MIEVGHLDSCGGGNGGGEVALIPTHANRSKHGIQGRDTDDYLGRKNRKLGRNR